MGKSKLDYSEYSDTIRQLPENFLIAHRVQGIWKCEPDLAADRELATKVFLSLFIFENKYEKDPINLLRRINCDIEPQLGKSYSVDWDGESHIEIVSIQKDQILLYSKHKEKGAEHLLVSYIEFKTIVNHEI
mgnify:CR=1 FL=1|tara:strand:+ start:67285 stop:67680 length:396 start_codon:yes stop_codon:yes gene_type:complete